ncbi:MAG: dehypoxanthine futalosine cyclase [Thermoplasmata archaeon]|nr:dehypoxanthine futalosine cyclase [Thermoplasmata archaeon]|tara:strand:+ start:3111 stop:4283 length:1173 start_codon:yes stop_codon:yes gene_type:complete
MSNWRDILTRQMQDDPPRLTIDEAIILYNESDLNHLRQAAFNRKKQIHSPEQVTYLIDRNINYGNACTINCQFCSFYVPPNSENAYLQTKEQISARIRELEDIGGSRILMQGGVDPNLEIEWYENLLSYLQINHPSIHLDCFSPIEIEGIAEVCGMNTLDVLSRLKNSGLHGLPGGGAEMLVDDVRLDISPKKGGAGNWLKIMSEAHSIGLITSATNVIGFGETNKQRILHMNQIRELQDSSIKQGLQGFTSFISWTAQLENNSFGKKHKGKILPIQPPEYLRHVAISRLFLDNIDHIQASWLTMGIDIAQLALFGGADDIGSTMMEENVVSAAGTTKVLCTEEELQYAITKAGFKPKRRDSEYNLLETPKLVIEAHQYISPPMIQYNVL